ncbi:hypothetical protein F503_00206 [Ophiostoma piceae UAMH 11346]|uniref:Rho-GAP domain-containing protein n=1 Tax=Ophiostoma piceae (strain UAMH 11346) TaxID=1262450 RepID=S3BWX6_OPHP1|nr:hypothetical protein F503_00206 [Ophiostoma piceae UAMH 11346]
MEQSIPPWALPASPRPARSMGTGAAAANETGLNSGSSVMCDSGGDTLDPSQQDLIIQEYNRCAEKHGLRPLLFGVLGNGDQDGQADQSDLGSQGSDRRNWFARAFGKPSTASPRRSSRHSERSSKHRRSDSESDRTTLPQFIQSLQASQAPHGSKPDTTDTLKNQSLETLNGPEARGIFRISGSMRVVNELYDYYCINIDDDEEIAATVRAPNLPFHIKCSVHDVASMFKRLLSGLPGGILGYLGLFDALVDILKLDPEPYNAQSKTDSPIHSQTKARLIALAVGSVPEVLQRELICAVFGLLSLVGSTAETEPVVSGPSTPGSSLPHSEKMGFAALGIIFGPLLVGDHLSSYYLPESSSDSSLPAPSMASQPETPSPRSKTDKGRKSMASDRHAPSSLPSALDKIFLANDVAQMVISNWQGAVSQMRQIGIMRKESMLQQTKHKRPEAIPLKRRKATIRTCAKLEVPRIIESRLGAQANKFLTMKRLALQVLPPHNLPSQRPSDMSFEEFTARKKLRSHASSMSIASDSTYSAITPQPVRPLSPQSEDPFYVPDQKATATRFSVARLTKQRRISGGISSLFSDKSASPTKSSPKIARKAIPSSGEGQASPSPRKRSGTISSPWGVSLSPVKPKKAADSGLDQGPKAPPLPMPITPKNTRQQHLDTKLCRSEPAGRVGVGGTPQSKTVALIAKIINTRPQEISAPATHTNKLKPVDSLYTGRGRAEGDPEKPNTFLDDPKHATARVDMPLSSRQPATLDKAFSSDNVPQVSSTPATVKTSNKDPMHPARNHHERSPEKKSEEPKYSPLSQRSLKRTNPPITPQRRPLVSLHNSSEDARSQDRKPLHIDARARDPKSTIGNSAPPSPLAEIKNDARGQAQSQMKTTSVVEVTRIKLAPDESPGKLGAKTPAIGSSVRAMAALFDGTPWSCSSDSPSKGQVQISRSQAAPQGPALTQYTNNIPAALKVARPVTPARPLSDHIREVLGVKDTRQRESASMQQLATERRRLRLSKSEDRSARLVRAHQHVTVENKDAARSVDGKNIPELSRRKPTSQTPLRSSRTNQLHDPESPSERQARAKLALSVRRPAIPAVPQITGKLASLQPPADDTTSTKKLQQLLDSKSTESERWQVRAEAAERRVAELELLLSLSDVGGKTSGNGSFALHGNEENWQPWEWQDLLPAPALLKEAEETPDTPRGLVSSEREVAPRLRKEKRRGLGLGRDSVKDANRTTDTDDGYASESSTTTVVVHGRLADERLMPFS